MKKTSHIFSMLMGIFLILGCSTKKDAFLNRGFHAVSTKYNVLYNGNESLKSGLKDLNENYKDDYWKILPIEPLKIDELSLPGMVSKDNSPEAFQKAEEKAVKAIQRHSMNIGGKEHNKQIDDAFLLLGKSRYYSQRFVPALESFNYVIKNYPNANLINETKIWQSKSHIRLRNEEQAVETLKILLNKKDLTDHILADGHTALAMAYTSLDSTEAIVHHLNKAVLFDENAEQKARNLFILGQIYREEQKIDSANLAFDKVIGLRKAPYKYKIHAQIERAKNSTNEADMMEILGVFKKLIANRDNRKYLDELYYHKGMLELKTGNDSLAASHFENSVHARGAQEFQKSLSYEALADLYFERADFPVAGAYYDSIIQIPQDKNTKRFRRIERRRKNLEEVILYENISRVNDSILSIASMSDAEKNEFFKAHIAYLKDLEESKKEPSEKVNYGSELPSGINKQASRGKWYFYNIQVVGFGVQEFERIWGNRPLEDNWRLSDKSVIDVNQPEKNKILTTDNGKSEVKYDINFYLSQIPTDQKQLDSISVVRNDAYYRLGLIYKEQFKEYDIAAEKLEYLLQLNPENNLVLPATYHLYKIYEILNDSRKDEVKNKIIERYPNSKYAQIIQNPNKAIAKSGDENSPEKIYASIYYDYKDEKYEEVISKCNAALSELEGMVLIPKFELLKAYAIGKKEGMESFKKALEYVVLTYPTSEEGKKAFEVIETIKAKL